MLFGPSALLKEVRKAMKRISIILLTVCISNLLAFAQQDLIDLQNLAIANNPALQAKYKSYEAIMRQPAQRAGLPDPTIGVGYFISPVETRVGPQKATFSVSQTLPWFGSQSTQEQAGNAMAFEVMQSYNSDVAKIKYDVAKVYFEIYKLEKQIDITQRSIVLLNSRKELTQNKLESGQGGLLEIIEVDMEVEILKNELARMQDAMLPLETNLNQLVYSDLESIAIPQRIWTDSISSSMDQILNEVETSNPNLKEIEAKLSTLNLEMKASEKQSTPTITLGLNYTVIGERSGYQGEDNGRDALLPTLGVKLPLYRNKHNARTNQKSIEIESVAFQKKDVINKLEHQVTLALSEYRDAVRRVDMNENLIDYANQALELLITKYSASESGFDELLAMDRRVLNYRLALLEAEADRNSRVAFINYLKGI